jgi:hypothetical protein
VATSTFLFAYNPTDIKNLKRPARRKKLVGKSREVFCHSIRTIGLRKDKQRRFEAV